MTEQSTRSTRSRGKSPARSVSRPTVVQPTAESTRARPATPQAAAESAPETTTKTTSAKTKPTARTAAKTAAKTAAGTAGVDATARPAPARARGGAATEERRCGWCSKVLPSGGSIGRPRLYCGQACRQRAYEQRSTVTRAGLAPDLVVVKRAELDGLQDRLFQLRCAIEDVQTLLNEKHTKSDLERSLDDLVRATGRLDRLWVSERELSLAARAALAG